MILSETNMNTTLNSHQLINIISNFNIIGEILQAVPYGDGHINLTYKISTKHEANVNNYILQRVNSRVFMKPIELMNNIQQVTKHLSSLRIKELYPKYEVLELVYTKDNQHYFLDTDNEVWRMYVFIEQAIGFSLTDDIDIIQASGEAFGSFQKMLENFPAFSLNETIKDFHNTPIRFLQLKDALSKNSVNRVQSCQIDIDYALSQEYLSNMITKHLYNGKIPLRVTHNDTKLNNVLIDPVSKEARCVIDLDTVMPGSLLFDFGDSIRFCVNTASEDEKDLDKVSVDLEKFRAFARGFLHETKDVMTTLEKELLPFAGPIMTLECGIRFLADYINGDIYFKTTYSTHNLVRAQNQLKLYKEQMKNIDQIRKIIISLLSD